MIITKDTVRFEHADTQFVNKYGFMRACEMVREHIEQYDTPFIHDTYQLATALGMRTRHLFYLLRNIDDNYYGKELQKKSGGVRVLQVPSPWLKETQTYILRRFLAKMPISPYATAYRKGGRLSSNAKPHVGHTYLLKMDITDFFDSITFPQIIGAAFPRGMYPEHIRVMLTQFCCKNDRLPQGAPTSPAISNIVMRQFDNRLGAWCEKHDIVYTRYCDDLTFSANVPLFAVYQKATRMLEDMGFAVNEKKTRFVKNTARQAVTGLTVNEKVGVSADYKCSLRQEVYYANKFGLADSIIKGNKTDFIRNGKPDIDAYYHHLCGKINFLLSVQPDDAWFLKEKKRLHVVYRWECKENA